MSIQVNDLSGAYQKFLVALGVKAREDGSLVQVLLDTVENPVLVANKPLYLPTKEVTSNYNDGIVILHPIGENIIKGESPVIQELRYLAMENVTFLTLLTMESLMKVALDKSIEDSLSPTQVTYLKALAGVDETALKNWQKIMRASNPRGENRVVNIFLKRSYQIKSEEYKRVAIVNFNLYNELTEGKLSIFGVKVRKSDVTLYSKMLEAIFDDIFIIDHYSCGSNSLVAPYFDALVGAVTGLIKQLNKTTWLFRKPFQEAADVKLHVNDEYSELFKDLLKYRDVLPMMPYNDGDDNTKRESTEQEHWKRIPANEVAGNSKINHVDTPYYEPTQPLPTNTITQPVYNTAPTAQQFAQSGGYQQPSGFVQHLNAMAQPQVPMGYNNPYNYYANAQGFMQPNMNNGFGQPMPFNTNFNQAPQMVNPHLGYLSAMAPQQNQTASSFWNHR